MGWWGYGVAEGDAPDDILIDLVDRIHDKNPGVDFDEVEMTQEHWMKARDQSFNYFRNETEDTYFEPEIAGQVFVAFAVHNGFSITEEMRDWGIKCAEDDEWAKEEPQRKLQMDSLISVLKQYPLEGGTKFEIEHKGLMETMFEALEKEQQGKKTD